MMEPIQQPFEGFAQITDQMPTVDDVLGLWRAQCGAARLRHGAITAEDGDTRMGPEPGGKRVSRAVGQEIKRPMALQVHQQGAIGAPATHGPIVHAKDGGRRHGRIRQLADKAQQGIGAGEEMERGPQPRPGLAAQRKPKLL